MADDGRWLADNRAAVEENWPVISFSDELPLSELPEGDRGGVGDVQGIYAVGHGYADHIVRLVDVGFTEAIALITKYYREPGLLCDLGIIEGPCPISQCHRYSFETHVVEAGGEAGEAGVGAAAGAGTAGRAGDGAAAGTGKFQPGPGYLEDGAHGHTEHPPVQRVAASPSEQDCIKAQCRSAPEYGPDVGTVDDSVEDSDAGGGTTGTAAYVFGGGEFAPTECAHDTAGQGEASHMPK